VKLARPQREIVASDVNPGMLEYAAKSLKSETVSLRPVQFARFSSLSYFLEFPQKALEFFCRPYVLSDELAVGFFEPPELFETFLAVYTWLDEFFQATADRSEIRNPVKRESIGSRDRNAPTGPGSGRRLDSYRSYIGRPEITQGLVGLSSLRATSIP
jgi:hypothetical protein